MSSDHTARHPVGEWRAWLDEHRNDASIRKLEPFIRRVLDRAVVRDGDRMLDLGTGLGLVARAAAAGNPAGLVAGLDSDIAAVAACAERHEGFVVGLGADAERLPFRSQSLDVVTAFCVLVYVPHKLRAIGEIFRVLRSGGRVAVFEPVHQLRLRYRGTSPTMPSYEPDHSALMSEVDARLTESARVLAAFSADDLADWFAAAGFNEVTVRYELTLRRVRSSAEDHRAALSGSLPGHPSLEGLARRCFGDAADEYLAAYAAELAATSHPVGSATVTLSAVKP